MAAGNFGYSIEWEEKKTRKHGAQKLPSQVRFDSEDQFINALGKAREVQLFRANISVSLSRLPQLRDWLVSEGCEALGMEARRPRENGHSLTIPTLE